MVNVTLVSVIIDIHTNTTVNIIISYKIPKTSKTSFFKKNRHCENKHFQTFKNLSVSKIFIFYNKMYHKFKRELQFKTFSVFFEDGWFVHIMCFVIHLNLQQSQFFVIS